jgi:AraC-like DNA-binding protein
VPAHLTAETHLQLEDVWGTAAAAQLLERLGDAGHAEARIEVFETILAERLPRLRGLHPAVAAALPQLRAGRGIGWLVAQSGFGHRHFARLFLETVGLSPKLYARVSRFARVIQRVTHEPAAPWADVAAEAGYADQPHFNREFRALAGFAPGRYRALGAGLGRHVPL